MGERSLSKFQYGIESTRGTAVAATRVLGADIKAVPIDRAWEPVRYATGRRVNANYKRNDQLLVRDTLVISNGYFQALPILHQCSLDGTITPAEQTVGQSDYKWDVTPSLTAANDPDTFTLEMGDDVQAFEVEYCMVDRIKLAGQISDDGSASPVSIEFSYFGRQLTATTFTASQSLHSGLELMNAKLARVYLANTWAALSSPTEQSVLRGFEIELLAGNHPKPFGSANKYFTTHGEGLITTMVTLDLEGTSVADAIWDLHQAGTERALRLDINGSQIGSGVNYLYRVDVFGFFQEVVPLNEERQMNNLHRVLFVSKDDGSGNFLDIDIITNHNTV